MSVRLPLRLLLLLSGSLLVLPVRADTKETTAAPVPVEPGPADGRIAFVTAKLLEQMHYLKQSFDQSVSSKFFDKYFESLDPQHVHFLQSDVAEFERYRTNLDRMTLTRRGVGDVTPGTEIFNRFVERLEQRVNYADQLLKKEQFKFDTDEKINVSRKDAPYPKDMKEAQQLWRERLRFEYLQEHLGKVGAKKKTEAAPKTPKKTEAEEIVETLSHRYHRNLRIFTDWNNDDVLQVYLNTLAHVYDPHSDYLGHSQLDSFAISMNLSLSGIGAELISDDGYCTIRKLVPGGPAAKGKKIKEKDRIVAVAQSNQPPVDVVDMNLNKVVQMIRGTKGTEVRLTVIPADADSATRNVVAITRDEIKLEDQAAKASIIELPAEGGQKLRLGVIDLPSFYTPFDLGGTRSPLMAKTKGDPGGISTSADVEKILKKLKQENVSGVVLDLRRNGGGSLEEAVKVTGLFIKDGPVVQVRDWQGGVQEEDDKDSSVAYDGPLIVLTSRFSASASEIVAGALQDYGRALLVGDSSTHGKGTVQSVNNLKPYMSPSLTNDPGAVKLTIKKFYRASGASTQLKGVVPDIILPSVLNESKDIGESALDNPLPWDTIESAKYDRLNLAEPYVPELRKRSTARIAQEPEFKYIREDISLFKKAQADKTISLNEKQRLKEKEEADARQKTRDKERLARAEMPEKVYELTMSQVEQPGLPAPVTKTNALLAKANQPQVSVVSTNSAAANVPVRNVESTTDEESDDAKATVPDASLQETEHILVDYLSLLPKKQNLVSAGHTAAVQHD